MKMKRFKEYLLEDVGAKYAEKEFHIPSEFAEFDKQYKRKYNNMNQEIIYKDNRGLIILKNPNSLEYIEPNVRGIIDNKGNLFVEQESATTHIPMIGILCDLGIIKDIDNNWWIKPPTNFITVQRKNNEIKIGESNAWYSDNKPKSTRIFQEFLNKAKEKNPNIDFVNQIIYSPWE